MAHSKRNGIFEILKHITPGIVCDLFVPLMIRLYGTRPPGALAWSVLGGLMGLGRFATIFTITLAVQPPAVAWAFLVPGLIIHTSFGVLSGLVSSPLIRALAREKVVDPPPVVTPSVASLPAEGMTKEET